MPVLFIGHGSPMNVVLKNDFTESLRKLGQNLPRAEVILVVSAHWLTRGTFVICEPKPKQIYDFYGFPDELYSVSYHPAGTPETACRVTQAVKNATVHCESAWGLDHASWAILHHLYPDANIPVFEMSLDATQDESHHYQLARELSDLRNEGVLIIGSGNLVHNLRLTETDIYAAPVEWAVEVDERMKALLLRRRHEELILRQGLGGSASLAIPSNEHYLPMLYTIALQEQDEEISFTFEGFQNGTISMRSFRIG